jgi:hypothetical protein
VDVSRLSKQDLAEWANTKNAEGQLPELIRRLILASNPSIELVVFPYGDSIGRSGLDGYVRARESSPYVAEGCSVWECGRNKDHLQKANDDFKKRTNGTSEIRQSNLTYCFVTPRHWEKKSEWEKCPGKEEDKIENKWKSVRVLDADDLIGWLSDCPGVEAWFLRTIRKATAGVHDAEGYWTSVATTEEDIVIQPNVLLGGREELAKKVESFLSISEQRPKALPIVSRSPDEIVPFAVATVVSSSNEAMVSRTLVIESRESWEKISREESGLGLIVSPRIQPTREELQHASTRNHRVIYCALDGDNQLPRLTRFEVFNSLLSSGIEEAQATQLADRCGGNGQLLLDGLSGIATPVGSTCSKLEDRIKVACLLLYGWDGSHAPDRKVFSDLCGSAYEDIECSLKNDSRDSSGMTLHADGKFRLLAPERDWIRYSPLITKSVLKQYESLVPLILTDDDPTAGMSGEERIQAQFQGKRQQFSKTLRQSVARSLAIVASIGSARLHLDHSVDVSFVDGIVNSTLKDATFNRWASFRDELSIIAEAAPEEVLLALKRDLQTGGPLHEVMQRDNPGLFESPAQTGVLWALERLCWSSIYLLDAIAILFRLHCLNPGLKSGNNPANSIRETLQSACPQTNAEWSIRQKAITQMLKQDAGLAFPLVLSLFPSFHSSWLRRHLPVWRDWGYGYRAGTTYQQIAAELAWCVEQLMLFAGEEAERWCALIELCGSIEATQYASILDQYQAVLASGRLSQQAKRRLWESINAMLIRMEWAASQRRLKNGEIVDVADLNDPSTELEIHFPGDAKNLNAFGGRLRELLNESIPEDPVLAGCHAFLGGLNPYNCRQHFSDRFNVDKQDELIMQARDRSIAAVWKADGLTGVRRLSQIEHVDANAVGRAVATSKGVRVRPQDIIRYLSSDTKSDRILAQGYLNQWSWEHRDSLSTNVFPLLSELSSNESIANFLQSLPITEEVWDFIDKQEAPIRCLFWKKAPVPWKMPNGRLAYFVRHLIDASRSDRAVELLVRCIDDVGLDEVELVFAALESLPLVERNINENHGDSLHWEIRQIFEKLYDVAMSQVLRLVGLELLYHQVFECDEGQRFQPKALLNVIRDQPSLFVEMVSYSSADDSVESTAIEDEATRIRVTQLCGLLFRLAELPGQSSLCPIEGKTLADWVVEVLHVASESKCIKSVVRQLVRTIAWGSWKAIDSWPDEGLAEAINIMSNRFPEIVSRHLVISLSNARGVHWCDPSGKSENNLSKKIANRANQLRFECPAASQALREIANRLDAESKGNVEESNWER